MTSTPLARYQLDIEQHGFSVDPAQQQAVARLQKLYEDFQHKVPPETKNTKNGIFGKLKGFLSQPEPATKVPAQGVYMWGGVGRGKTYLMDTLYECLPSERKLRMHFHRFMLAVHEQLNALGDTADPLQVIADDFAQKTDIICFDEFFVSDITDAMILGTLFEALFARGIALVATSNIPPQDLYRNGLQRARFLPAIALIEKHCDILNVDAGTDYRMRTLTQAEIFHSPLDVAAQENLNRYFEQLSTEPRTKGQRLEVNHREIQTLKEADGVLLIDFSELCQQPRSQHDYIELSRCYHTVLLANVPQMGREDDNAARRFIAMVDEFYERNVTLIMSANVVMEELYTDGLMKFEFARCLSRLTEMQSHEYLAKEHLP